MKTVRRSTLLGIVGLGAWLLAATLPAADSSLADRPSDWRGTPDPTEDEPVPELEAVLPPAPRDADLVPLWLESVDSRFDYLLDARSLSLGADGVFRYTIVIRSPSGTENVLYEGLRCDPSAYKTYAYLGSGGFKPTRDRRWREMKRTGPTAYRSALAEEYVCVRAGQPARLDGIVSAVRDAERERRLFKKTVDDVRG